MTSSEVGRIAWLGSMTRVWITDDHVTGITCAATVLTPAGSPGDHTTCHGSYVITNADAANGLVTNTTVASGTEDGHVIGLPPSQQTLLCSSARPG